MKNIILTGSSSGFGLLAVQTLAKQGHTVFATMRNINTTNAAVAQEIQQWAVDNDANVQVVELDVTSDTSTKNAIAEVVAKTDGKIDVLINNAGIAAIGLNESFSSEQVNQIFQVNVIGSDRLIKAVLPYMHQQKSGLLIQLSSGLARLHLPYMGAYVAAKVAIDAIAETYHYELRSSGIDSVVVQPGGYPTTDIIAKQLVPDNLSVAANYGEDSHQLKSAIENLFVPTETSPDPQEVADLIAQIVDTPTGQRSIWYPIGVGAILPYVEQLNAGTEQLASAVISSLGVDVPA